MTLLIASQWCAPVGHAEGRSPMKTSSYRERDYAFGQLMLTLRTRIGLTQAGLGERLRVSRRAVVEWEGGLSYPTAGHLQALIALGVQQRIFASGRESDEQTSAVEQAVAQPALGSRPDWGEALDVPTFSGREGVGDATRSEAVLFRDQLLTTKFFIPSPSHAFIPRP